MTVAYHLSNTNDGGVLLSTFPKGTTKILASFVFTLSFMLSAKQQAMIGNFPKFLVILQPESNYVYTVSQAEGYVKF